MNNEHKILTALEQLHEQIDSRFEQIDSRFEQIDSNIQDIKRFQVKVEHDYWKRIVVALDGIKLLEYACKAD